MWCLRGSEDRLIHGRASLLTGKAKINLSSSESGYLQKPGSGVPKSCPLVPRF